MKQTKEQIITESYAKIKLNDKCLALLSELQNVVEKLNPGIWEDDKITQNFLYKDNEGNELDNFWSDLQSWIDRNETYLINDSIDNFKNLQR